MLTAYVRPPAASLPDCALTHLERQPIDVELARWQHRGYREALTGLGAEVRELGVLDEHPDSCFVEDTALVLDEVAVITRPALEVRRGEVESVAEALRRERELLRVEAPATIEGGDILLVEKTLFVGRTSRSNREGREALATLLEPFGYEVRGVSTPGCLHLKSAVTRIGSRTLLVNPAWIDTEPLAGLELVEVDPSEPSGANTVWTGDAILMPASYPRTTGRLEERGLRVTTVDLSEFQKAEGATTCLSLLVRTRESMK